MWAIIKFSSLLLSPAVILIYGYQLVELLTLLPANARLQTTVLGFAAGSAFWMVFAKHLTVWHILEHEITHSLVGLLFFRPIRSLAADQTGGVVTFSGQPINFVIVLAPYFLPTTSMLWLAGYAVFKPEFLTTYLAVLGFCTGYHVTSNFQEFHLKQPDIQQSGVLFSVAFCLAASLMFLGFIFAVAAAGPANGVSFIEGGIHTMADCLGRVLQSARALLAI